MFYKFLPHIGLHHTREVLSLASFCLPLGGQNPMMTPQTSSWPHILRATVQPPFVMPSCQRPWQSSINSHRSLIWTLPIPTRGHRTIPSLQIFMNLPKVGGSPLWKLILPGWPVSRPCWIIIAVIPISLLILRWVAFGNSQVKVAKFWTVPSIPSVRNRPSMINGWMRLFRISVLIS